MSGGHKSVVKSTLSMNNFTANCLELRSQS